MCSNHIIHIMLYIAINRLLQLIFHVIIPSKSLLFCFWALNFFLWAFIAFSFHFCHVWLKFSCVSTSRLFCIYLYLSTSVVCLFLIQFPSCFFYFRYLLLPGIFLHCSAFNFSGQPHCGTTRGFKKSYTNAVISMWNPFTNAFPLASQSYSLNVKVVIYVPPFVSTFSTLLHGCCCFY